MSRPQVHRWKILLLPATQTIVLGVNTVGFSILARLMGPEPFGYFAVLIFAFSIASLATDLAPQAYLLVHGITRMRWFAAARVCLTSWAGGSMLLGVLLAAQELTVWGGASLATVAVLYLGLTCHFAMQLPRAALILTRRYVMMAATDVAAASASVCLAIGLALAGVDAQAVLAWQLTFGLALRTLASWIVVGVRIPPADSSGDMQSEPDTPFRFGARALPLNVGSYASRTLDSGLVPLFVPGASGGVYARSYQLVVAPVNQFQLALGPAILARLGTRAKLGEDSSMAAFRQCWWAIVGVAAGTAALVSLFSAPISAVVFGRDWPDTDIAITAMACTLPAFACGTYLAWATQIFPRPWASQRHFVCVLIGPLFAVAGAGTHGIPGALWALAVVTGIAQPVLLLCVHRSVLFTSYRSACAQIAAAWIMPFSVFLVRMT